MLNVFPLREQLIVQLALFSGMRPGEILALQWKHVAEDHVQVVHRVYRGKLDQPKSERSKRTVALSSSTRQLIDQWRRQQGDSADLEAASGSVRSNAQTGRQSYRNAAKDVCVCILTPSTIFNGGASPTRDFPPFVMQPRPDNPEEWTGS